MVWNQRRCAGPSGRCWNIRCSTRWASPALPCGILARADVVADVDLDQLGRRVGHHHEAQAVGVEHAAVLGVLERELRRFGLHARAR